MRQIALLGVCFSFALAGCTMTTPSQVTPERIQVSQGTETIVLDRNNIKPSTMARIAEDYKNGGEGALQIYVSYPKDMKGAGHEATSIARRYENTLRDNGVHSVTAVAVPSRAADFDNRVVVSYTGYKAREPENCIRLPGRNGGETVYAATEYKVGCETMRYVSRMVDDPRDLLGRESSQDADARRSGNVVERYSSGEEMEPLDSSSVSNVGN